MAEENDVKRRPMIRSPNYPAYPLEEVLKRTKVFLDQNGRLPASLDVLAHIWNSSPTSSTFKLQLAAARAFCLLENADGSEDRLVRLSDLALDILADCREGSPDRRAAIQRAALAPVLHAQLREKYGLTLPHEHEVRRYLVRERGFNDKTVGDFIAEYRSTMAFAGLDSRAAIEEVASSESQEPNGLQTGKPGVGDIVRRVQPGVTYLNPDVGKVLGFSEDGEWAFLDGKHPDAVPLSELRLMKAEVEAAAAQSQAVKRPPPNPHYRTVVLSGPVRSEHGRVPPPLVSEWTGPHVRFDLPRGNVIEIRLKSKVTPAEFAKIKRIFDLSEVAFVEDEETPQAEESADE